MNLRTYFHGTWAAIQQGQPHEETTVMNALMGWLDQCLYSYNQRLLVNLPPSVGTSTLFARIFPAWLYSMKPEMRIGVLCSGAELAHLNMRLSLEIMAGERKIAWKNDNGPAHHFEVFNQVGGSVQWFSKGGGVFGKHFDVLIADAPIATLGWEDATPIFLDYWQNCLLHLVRPDANVFFSSPRQGKFDFSSALLGQGYTHISIPAKTQGVSNFSPRFTPELLKTQCEIMGNIGYMAQYQQEPIQ